MFAFPISTTYVSKEMPYVNIITQSNKHIMKLEGNCACFTTTTYKLLLGKAQFKKLEVIFRYKFQPKPKQITLISLN